MRLAVRLSHHPLHGIAQFARTTAKHRSIVSWDHDRVASAATVDPAPNTILRHMNPSEIVRSVVLFVVAGIAEIGGGYLVWLWLREGRPWWVGLIGGLVLVTYGVIPTLQPTQFDFAKVYAAYGGAFIILSLLWGRIVEGNVPDTPSIVGAAIALIGASVIIFWPRS